MRIAPRQLAEAMKERRGRYGALAPADFVAAVCGQVEAICTATLPRIDESLTLFGPAYEVSAIVLPFCRPTLGPGRDITWSIRLDEATATIELATGHFNRALLDWVHHALETRLKEILGILHATQRQLPALEFRLNNGLVSIKEAYETTRQGIQVAPLGSISNVSVVVSLPLLHTTVGDVGPWLESTIEILALAYYAITPTLEGLFATITPMEEAAYPEGALHYRLHVSRERDPRVIAEAKQLHRRIHGRLFCTVCRFDFAAVYGDRGRDFAEGHHTKPIGEMLPGDHTRASDIAIVCSNCHSMLHRSPLLSPEELIALMESVSDSG